MLASIWTAPEAVSIWAEVIAERKRMLSNLSENDSLHYSSLAASQVTISREQISLWDSSIRAWLFTANEACKFSHTQLRLIIENVGLGVNAVTTVYPSVIEAWLNAMTTVEKVLCGEGQSVLTGAPLLGLLSWHIYPDLLVLGETTKSIQLKDPLVPSGGLITLGLSGRDSLPSGVSWSLPLKYMRYYGHPVKSTGNVNFQTSRLTMEQLSQIALGCVVQGWTEGHTGLLQAAELITLIADLLCNSSPDDRGSMNADWSNDWLAALRAAAKALLNADSGQQSECLKLIRTAQRRYRNFLAGEGETVPPLFGLCDPATFMEIIREPEHRIEVLREIWKQYEDTGAQMIIQYTINGSFECASVRQRSIITSGSKRTRQGSLTGLNDSHRGCHVRWLAAPDPFSETEMQKKRSEDILLAGEEVVYIGRNSGFPPWDKSFSISGTEIPTIPFDLRPYTEYDLKDLKFVPLQRNIGGSDLAALYGAGDLRRPKSKTTNNTISLPIFTKALGQHMIDAEISKLMIMHSLSQSDMLVSLRALSTVEKIFKKMPGFTTPIKVAKTGIWKGKWIPKQGADLRTDQNDFRLSLEQTFACVTLFESGGFNLEPEHLREVMAISSGNSLFVPKVLLQDPCKDVHCSEIERITGNLGRPGISMLVPPKDPKILPLSDDCWIHINHNVFSGKRENCYPNSTLHLTFTGY